MRPIARQSTRLANSNRVRQPSRPPYLPQQHVRSFSWSTQHQVDTRGPNEPPDHSRPVEVIREEQRQRKDTETAAEKDKDNGEESISDGPKLAISKTRRQRRKEALNSDVPKPPPIPGWFLKHNVKLQEDTVKPNLEANSAQVLRCVDTETGHTLFTVPYYEAWPVPGVKTSHVEALKPKKDSSKKKPLESDFFDPKFSSTTAKPATKTRSAPTFTPPSEEPQDDVNPHTLLRWALLEAETSIMAGFTASGTTSQASSTAATRVDVSLRCPDGGAHEQMDELVEDLAAIVQADIVRLDANDFEDLLADYVGQGSDSPGSFANLAYDVFDGLGSSSYAAPVRTIEEEEEEDDELDEDEEDDENDAHAPVDFNPGFTLGAPQTLDALRKALSERRNDLSKALGMRVTGVSILPMPTSNKSPSQPMGSSDPQQYDDAKLNALLDNLLDAAQSKRATASTPSSFGSWRRLTQNVVPSSGMPPDVQSYQALFRFYRSSTGYWYPDIAGLVVGQLSRNSKDTVSRMEPYNERPAQTEPATTAGSSRTIIHVRDLKYLSGSRMGESVIRALVRVVQKRRRTGQEIMIVGTTARDTADSIFASTRQDFTDQEFRTITVPPFFMASMEDLARIKSEDISATVSPLNAPSPAKVVMKAVSPDRRVLEINLRHLQSMLNRLRPADAVDMFTERSLTHLNLSGGDSLGNKVLTFDEIQRVVLTAIGLAQTHVVSNAINASHIGLAVFLTGKADQCNTIWNGQKSRKAAEDMIRPLQQLQQDGSTSKDQGQARIEKIKKSCNQHESRLLPGVVDAQNIKTGFKEVHAPEETIDALRTLTSLSLLRPEAFKYGVLAADRLPGLMLYGPPGTGKTLLARAVAKESRATVLEISGAQIYEKYVGEGEKMVRAVFSLAKKLSPCIVFIDEADAIFGSRSSAGNRNTHREIINQFLREWDGMDNHNVFIMVASNRPFDMDDAVLRRLPRRLLVDLPVAKDRESILRIHLKDETLDDSVNLDEIADNTPLYSGSDLKNLCVAAALACVREENELANSKAKDEDFKLPEKRTLSARHFEKAVKEISASISEDMSSLTGIRKFDEQYGERRGRKKKASYGFGAGGDAAIDENSARVRQADQSPPSP